MIPEQAANLVLIALIAERIHQSCTVGIFTISFTNMKQVVVLAVLPCCIEELGTDGFLLGVMRCWHLRVHGRLRLMHSSICNVLGRITRVLHGIEHAAALVVLQRHFF